MDTAEEARTWVQSLGFEPLWSPAEVDPACPWAGEAEPEEVVRQTFAPIAEHAPEFVERLAQAVRAVFVTQKGGYWFALYVLVEEAGPCLFGGGPPNDDPRLGEEHSALEWRVPESLRAFYAVHEGFGWVQDANSFWWQRAVLPAAALYPLDVFAHFGEDEVEDFGNLLMFSSNGSGQMQCFQRTARDEADPPTVVFDTGRREVGEPQGFWTWLEAHIGPDRD